MELVFSDKPEPSPGSVSGCEGFVSADCPGSQWFIGSNTFIHYGNANQSDNPHRSHSAIYCYWDLFQRKHAEHNCPGDVGFLEYGCCLDQQTRSCHGRKSRHNHYLSDDERYYRQYKPDCSVISADYHNTVSTKRYAEYLLFDYIGCKRRNFPIYVVDYQRITSDRFIAQ